jgi:hypothetical protein
MRRPHDERQTHRSIVVPASGAPSYAPEPLCAKSDEMGQAPATEPDPVGLGDRLRPTAAPSDLLARHPGCAVVAEICLLRTASGIRVIEAHDGAATLGDFLAAAVAYEDRLSCHVFLLWFGGGTSLKGRKSGV